MHNRFLWILVLTCMACIGNILHVQADGQASGGDFVYPFDQVANPKCRFSAWDTLSSDCKISLPRIEKADYPKYKDNTTYRRLYSILWGGTYTYGWDQGKGSHGGVDIATSLGTPVRSIGKGEVLVASNLAGWGNTVVIKHTLPDNTVIYSTYSHLSEILVKKGDTVEKAAWIGKVGATGNAYGNHLHFQVDTLKGTHPYYYNGCGKGVDEMKLVNEGQCRKELIEGTLDPIAFLEQLVSAPKAPVTQSVIQNVEKQTQSSPKIDQSTIRTRESIIDEEINDFINQFVIKISYGTSGKTRIVGVPQDATIAVTYQGGTPYNGNFPGNGIEMIYDHSKLRMFPERIIALDKGLRTFQVTGITPGQHTVDFKFGKKLLFTSTFSVYKQGELSYPQHATYIGKKSIRLGEYNQAVIAMQTPGLAYQIRIPYQGRYTLDSISGKVKFCNISSTPKRTCAPREFTPTVTFGYADTIGGLLLVQMVGLDYEPITLRLRTADGKQTLFVGKNPVTLINPTGLSRDYVYYDAAIASLRKNIAAVRSGYALQDRDMDMKTAKDVLLRSFDYVYLKSGEKVLQKKRIDTLKNNFTTAYMSADNYAPVSRSTFLHMILSAFRADLPQSTVTYFIDQKGTYESDIRYAASLGFRWKDEFGQKYFQPNKTITIGEGLYLIDFFLAKFYGF